MARQRLVWALPPWAMRPELVMKSIIPVVMAGILGIYGLIIAVIISTGGALRQTASLQLLNPSFTVGEGYTLYQGYAHLGSGLACGLAGLAAGMAIGIVGDSGVRYASMFVFVQLITASPGPMPSSPSCTSA